MLRLRNALNIILSFIHLPSRACFSVVSLVSFVICTVCKKRLDLSDLGLHLSYYFLSFVRGKTSVFAFVLSGTMTTARYRPTWDLALDPLVSCKLCLGEFPLEQMTTITQCQCVFCTLVSIRHFIQSPTRAAVPDRDEFKHVDILR